MRNNKDDAFFFRNLCRRRIKGIPLFFQVKGFRIAPERVQISFRRPSGICRFAIPAFVPLISFNIYFLHIFSSTITP